MKVVFSDLDGTLLSPGTCAWKEAESAVSALRRRDIPLVFCTSKTRAEVEFWRRELGNTHPFIVENGAAVFIPPYCFPFSVPCAVARSTYQMAQFGTPRRIVLETLERVCRQTGQRIRSFSKMTAAEIAEATGLSLHQARLAAQREYDEPFDVMSDDHRPLLRAIEERGMRWTLGGRFYHISGSHDKALAVQWLSGLYRKAFGDVKTVGLGDAPNDIEFLNSVDTPIVVRSAYAAVVHAAVPGSRMTSAAGAAGWSEAVLQLLAV